MGQDDLRGSKYQQCASGSYPGMKWGDGFITNGPTVAKYNLSDPSGMFAYNDLKKLGPLTIQKPTLPNQVCRSRGERARVIGLWGVYSQLPPLMEDNHSLTNIEPPTQKILEFYCKILDLDCKQRKTNTCRWCCRPTCTPPRSPACPTTARTPTPR